jgi:hypothetical protein
MTETKKTIAETFATFDAGLTMAYKAVNALGASSLEDQEFLDLYEKLKDRQTFAAQVATILEALSFRIGAERHHKWSVQERYYVYISGRYGQTFEPSLDALRDASGSSWHNLPFAAAHWQTVEKYRDKPGRKGPGIYYSIAAYDPQTGKLRKVEQVEIDKALEEKK